MGTRHLIAVLTDGEYKVAQYGQWDGYPEGQGRDILAHLATMDHQQFREKCRAARFMSEDEIEEKWAQQGAKKGSAFVSMDICDRVTKKHPELSRDTAAGILKLIHERPPGIGLSNSLTFAGDSLFCEWAYVIDFDKGTFEVFRGFNKEPLAEGERFRDMPRAKDSEYHPVKFVHSWPLDQLPAADEFLETFKTEDEE